MAKAMGGRSNRHDNNFNLIRLFAALQVALVHALTHFEFSNTAVARARVIAGVPIFFLLSGYLIVQSYQRVQDQPAAHFFANRSLRIFPALVTCTLVSVWAVSLTGYFERNAVGAGQLIPWLLAQTTLVQFYNPEFMREFGVGVLNGSLWTISVELQFYALTPLLVRSILRWPRVAGALFLLSLGANLYLNAHPNPQTVVLKLLFVSFLPWLYMYMLGGLLALKPALKARAEAANTWLILAFFLLSMNYLGPYRHNAGNSINPVAFCCLGVLVFKLASASLPLPGTALRFIQRTDFSYGLYLFHMPVINLLLELCPSNAPLLQLGLALGGSSILGLLSWYIVERPALAFKR